jgi:hypothetical protein
MTVEFKSQPVSNKKLSHSLASFANSAGGWYIVGVETDADNVASSIPGCDLQGRDYMSTIRDVAISSIDPVPLFEARLIHLSSGTSVVVVHVPNNQATPFVTSDGRIYRRAGDSSGPVAETDRHSLDRLVDKGREQDRRLTRFMNAREADIPEGLFALEFFLAPDPLSQTSSHLDELTAENVRGIINRLREPVALTLDGVEGITGTAPFMSAAFRDHSVILRQTLPENPLGASTELELTVNAAARIRVPLELVGNLETLDLDTLSSPQARRALKTVRDYGQSHYSSLPPTKLELYDLRAALLVAAVLICFFSEWAADDLWSRRVRVAHRLVTEYGPGVWPVVFSDSDAWGQHAVEYGLPTVQRREYALSEPIWTTIDLDQHGSLWANCLLLASWSLGIGDSLTGIFSESLARGAKPVPTRSAETGDV